MNRLHVFWNELRAASLALFPFSAWVGICKAIVPGKSSEIAFFIYKRKYCQKKSYRWQTTHEERC